ncbi:xylulokinase [Listeria costaricensis]|uniref:xylulokinase n=1 Tax=Listeria costaricensis TaxID=2026604 RepID=UPI000C088F90|nr:xylulokinase [Listeria costaricensis]
MKYIVGIDLGTSALKALLVAEDGTICAESSAAYPLYQERAGFSEQNPEDWYRALEDVMRVMAARPESKDIVGISFSGQMHSLVLLDQAGQVVRPAILWNDVRTTAECEQITEALGERLLEITKNRALEGFTLPKLLWVRENEPENWARAVRFLLPKDYLGFRMTGQQQMDFSDAAGTLLLDLARREWSAEMLERFDLPVTLCPRLVASTDRIGTVLPELAAEWGLPEGIAVFAGGADNACAAVGAGILAEGSAMLSIGTSGVFLTVAKCAEQAYQGKLHLFAHAAADRFYAMGVTLAAGHSLSWFKEQFAKESTYEELLADTSELAPGSDGLLFAPYIMGERTPYPDSQIRGSFIGIDGRHTRRHFAKAVLEGITFSLRDSMALMEQHTDAHFSEIISVGGGAKNSDWLQMQADIFNVPIRTLKSEQGPAMGAAMIAAVGAGLYETLEEAAERLVAYAEVYTPNAAAVQEYQRVYALYRQIYPATRALSHQLRK